MRHPDDEEIALDALGYLQPARKRQSPRDLIGVGLTVQTPFAKAGKRRLPPMSLPWWMAPMPAAAAAPAPLPEAKPKKAKGEEGEGGVDEEEFRICLVKLEEKLLENEKLKSDKELYLRADRTIPYGRVLMTMARIRKAGITKFGLVAEPDLEQ
mgnify:CR=1 FL=1